MKTSASYAMGQEKGKIYPIVDSGASKTVTGLSWLTAWANGLSQDALRLSPNTHRRFKFGSQRVCVSLGTYRGMDCYRTQLGMGED